MVTCPLRTVWTAIWTAALRSTQRFSPSVHSSCYHSIMFEPSLSGCHQTRKRSLLATNSNISHKVLFMLSLDQACAVYDGWIWLFYRQSDTWIWWKQPLSTLWDTLSGLHQPCLEWLFQAWAEKCLYSMCVCVSSPYWYKTSQNRQLFYFILPVLSTKWRQIVDTCIYNHTQNICWHVIGAHYNLLHIIDGIDTPGHTLFHGRHKTASISKQKLLKGGGQHH